ncbi:MAG: DoxX family membrane protein [Candidatus Nanohaloarchaea archaeon]|nr:DoxX family membrane protein [Candidatus Nanohaloarchaea archaeon]
MSWLSTYRNIVSDRSKYGHTVLRWSLGVTMFLAGFHKLFHPQLWAGYMAPAFASLLPIPPGTTMLFVHAPIEIAVGLLVLGDRYTSMAASVAALSMTTIILNLMVAGTAVDILIRDIAIFGLAVTNALVFADKTST